MFQYLLYINKFEVFDSDPQHEQNVKRIEEFINKSCQSQKPSQSYTFIKCKRHSYNQEINI